MTNPSLKLALVALVVGAGLMVSAAAFAATPEWQPQASERLIKLPTHYLKKSIDRDFQSSELGTALRTIDDDLRAKGQTLEDLNKAQGRASGAVGVELRHQVLAEKQAYIRMMGDRQDMRRKRLQTQVRLYDRLLRKMQREGYEKGSVKAELIDKQKAARARLERTVTDVDMAIFGEPDAKESKYSTEYEKNRQAIEKLVSAINAHPMNTRAEVDGDDMNREEYLKQLVQDSEAELAILNQEEMVLGYMAKMVALDALALSEDVADMQAEQGGYDAVETTSLSSAVDFFITD